MTVAHETNRVRRRREQQGMLLIELAAKIDRCPAFVSSVEHGFVPPSPVRRQQIADALSITPEQLWPEEYR